MGIGLTEFIQIPEIRQELDSEYPNPGEPASSELKVPNNGYSHRMVGNAFEFICRLHIYNQSETLIKPEITAPRWGDPKEIYPP